MQAQKIKYIFILFISATVAFTSCKDENGTPTYEKPALKVTQTLSEAGAGEKLPFSVDATGLNKLSGLKVDETYLGKTKTLLDSAFDPPKTGLQFAFNYYVPDSAVKGEEITLLFSITDVQGNIVSETKTFVVSNSKPKIVLSADKTTASQGDTINFTAVISSAVANLDYLEIKESINNTLGTSIKKYNFSANTANETYNFAYIIPKDVQAGQSVVLLFQVYNTEGALTTANQEIKVK